MNSKYFILPAAIISLSASLNLYADNHKSPETWTCADFLALDEQYQPNAVFWATAYSKDGKPLDSMFDVDATETVTPMLTTACEEDPGASFWDKLKDEWHKVKKDL
ncbi:acid stress chaperone HdeA [Microbulbifer aestuariivivens]|uniref:Acid stress chaperone HdeA n=1 Tax=Microbulbifer aestuariivivens TaxID=1908308 RepID=A0ABP9WSL6_9GAMM